MKVKNVKIPVSITTQSDAWADRKTTLIDLSADQARADIALVEAQRAHVIATANLNAAVAAKTTAEKRLATFRANLGSV